MKRLLYCAFLIFISGPCKSQGLVAAANAFIASLGADQKSKAVYPFESDERYNFHFFPKDDRKGLPWREMSAAQRAAASGLMKSCLSEAGIKKAQAIMQLETVLKALENRADSDHHRDPEKYYFTLFGVPGAKTVWGWRIEGHHLSFTFSAEKGNIISGTPGFMGANPAIVQNGPQAGTQVLKEEADAGFALLHSLSGDALKKALIDTTAPNEIITFVSRAAMIQNPAGLRYADMTPTQRQQLLQLVRIYVQRYTKLFADAMLKEIADAGLENLRFAWAGAMQPQIGKPHYYRIQGPTIIIEYDNSQNGANHVHSVVRDLKTDFGGDLLLEHYNAAHRS